MDTAVEVEDQPFDAESVGDSEDADLVPIQSGEDWVVKEYGLTSTSRRPHPVLSEDVVDGEGNLRAADIGITWENNETFQSRRTGGWTRSLRTA